MREQRLVKNGVAWEKGDSTGGVWQGTIVDRDEFVKWLEEKYQDWQEDMLEEMYHDELL